MSPEWTRVPALVSILLGIAGQAHPADFPFTGTLEIEASVGSEPEGFGLVTVAVSGTASIVGGVVVIPAAAFSAPIPSLSGFSGTLVNGAASFSAGGAGGGSTCPLVEIQEICISGGGFGGSMLLEGVLHDGQPLVVWGAGAAGTHVGSTSSGLTRTEAGTLWTEGVAAAWFYVPEIDPTPFTIHQSGTFRGLPSTFAGSGDPGFTLVTPMIVTSSDVSGSIHNARGIARLRIDFVGTPVPTAGAALLAMLLAAVGMAQLRRQRRQRSGSRGIASFS